MASRVTLKAVNDELARLKIEARLVKAGGYFYFDGGEAADWLDRTVPGGTIGSRSLEEWVGEFQRLKKLNAEIAGASSRKRRVKGKTP